MLDLALPCASRPWHFRSQTSEDEFWLFQHLFHFSFCFFNPWSLLLRVLNYNNNKKKKKKKKKKKRNKTQKQYTVLVASIQV